MLDPRHDSTNSARSPAPLAAATLLAASVTGALTYAAIRWLVTGCGCDESLYPDWTWAVLLALALPFAAMAVVLGWRLLRAIQSASPDESR
jgi:hypothetical protein